MTNDWSIYELALISINLIIPLTIAAILSFVLVKKDYWSVLDLPIDFGRTLFGRRIFGKSKTWRGLLSMTLFTVLLCMIFFPVFDLVLPEYCLVGCDFSSAAVVGLVLGAGHALGELPNSFLKRRLGIVSGTPARNILLRVLFVILDSIDSAAGSIGFIFIFGYLGDEFEVALTAFMIGALVHFLINLLLWKKGLKVFWA